MYHVGESSSYARWIAALYKGAQQYTVKVLQGHEFGSGQLSVLMTVLYHREGLTQDEIASYLLMDKGSASKAIKQLVKNKYLMRKIDTVDRRIKRVYRTEKLTAIEADLLQITEKWNKAITKNFSDKEEEVAIDILRRMAINGLLFLDKK